MQRRRSGSLAKSFTVITFVDWLWYCCDVFWSATLVVAGLHSFTTCISWLRRYTGGFWITLVQGGGNWEVRVKGDLSPRADNGRINSSPITAVSPIVILRHGVTHTITIPGKKSRASVTMSLAVLYDHSNWSLVSARQDNEYPLVWQVLQCYNVSFSSYCLPSTYTLTCICGTHWPSFVWGMQITLH